MFLRVFKKALLISIPLLGVFFFVLLGTDLFDSTKTNNYVEICDESGCHKHYSDDSNDKLINLRHSVIFYVDGVEVNREMVLTNTTVSSYKPADKKNYLFVGWSLKEHSSTSELFDFSTKITNDIKLYACFVLDTKTLIEKISKDTIKSNVKIEVTYYNSLLGITYESATLNCSGIIFSKNDYKNYFILSNYFPTAKEAGYDHIKYKIIDYLGNEYTGNFKHSSSQYGLAVLYFKEKSGVELKKISLKKENAVIQDDIICLSSPEGQLNSYTFGKIINYVKSNEINFKVMEHSAFSNCGSHGGAILDVNMKLVGINYAIGTSNNYGYAIPISKIREYLDKYIWSN